MRNLGNNHAPMNGTTSSAPPSQPNYATYATSSAMAAPPPGLQPHATESEGDLPTSLPSYLPPGAAQLPFTATFDVHGRRADDYGGSEMQSATKRQAPIGQWKTPPQFLFMANPAHAAVAVKPATTARGGGQVDSGQTSPSTGLRGMSFQDAPQPYVATPHQLVAEKSDVKFPTSEIGGISAAQFAAGTGGLTMDATLLARVSGTDPARMGSEEIKQIMRCPDLLSIYQKLQEEDDRRQRRLERNRASARVRREKKKGMVETYEGEVSKLENSLSLLRAHSFGTGQAQDLITALEYSGGEYARHAMMSKEAKLELLARILSQHSCNTTAVRRANMENQLLIATAMEDSDMARQLRAQLGLTQQQCQQLQAMHSRVQDEARKIDAINKCFSALRVHDWLYFPGIESLLHHTRNTMNSQQFQKFLSFTSENKETIEKLQFLPSSTGSDTELQFHFGED
ncbi:TPA: hypothetical protein N0F65_002383 [Lagenidium giganteum]|uniref:BZIP domain-containing protein n=1 Tax=Lagenidium giganteum TaxID=4803 RepID=A0AAV2YMW7_9STRA|nr:TPA: hypothetical protein N0F65_002383 [Lagenidium giganteum]